MHIFTRGRVILKVNMDLIHCFNSKILPCTATFTQKKCNFSVSRFTHPILSCKVKPLVTSYIINPIPVTEESYHGHQHRGISRSAVSDKKENASEGFRHLDFEQLNSQLKSKNPKYLIDVREKKELEETGTIPGSYHIPLGQIEQALTAPAEEFQKIYNFPKPTVDDQIIFSCRSGKRSYVALEKAIARGYKNAKHYTGGWLDWESKTSGN